MLIDEVEITIKAGHGGPGMSSFGGHGPDGGNGGKGGDVYISVTSDLRALNQFSAEKISLLKTERRAAKIGLTAKTEEIRNWNCLWVAYLQIKNPEKK